MPAVQVFLDSVKISTIIDQMQYALSKGHSTVNGYVITNKTPRLHDRSVDCYEFYVDYFMNPARFALVVDRVAYDMSYGNLELERKLNDIYYGASEYDEAMRKLQYSFLAFFGSDDFRRILIEELDSAMTEMISKAIVVM